MNNFLRLYVLYAFSFLCQAHNGFHVLFVWLLVLIVYVRLENGFVKISLGSCVQICLMFIANFGCQFLYKCEVCSMVLYVADFVIRSNIYVQGVSMLCYLIDFCVFVVCIPNSCVVCMLQFCLSDLLHCFSLLAIMIWCETTLCPQSQLIHTLCKVYSTESRMLLLDTYKPSSPVC